MIFKYKESLFKKSTPIIPSNPGTLEVDTFVLDYKPSGGVCLKKRGTLPLYTKIQKAKVNCDLQSVLEMCVHQNQLAVTTKDALDNAIADFTNCSSLSDMFTGMKALEQTWNELPLEVREQFNSSKANFVSSIGSEDYVNKVDAGFSSYYDAIGKRLDKVSTIVQDNVPSVQDVPSFVQEVSSVVPESEV